MKLRLIYIVLVLTIFRSPEAPAQADTDPPSPPVLFLLSVQPETGWTELNWVRSGSPDVAGYVVYYFRNGEGFAIDTIHNATASSYINQGSFSSARIESYVVAAIDSSGNISPLSNVLNTIFVNAVTDTCNKTINISWNTYPSIPKIVMEYKIMVSENNGPFTEAGQVSPSTNIFKISNFKTNMQYCFLIRANIEEGLFSLSDKACILTRMQRAPEWINADYATVNQNNKISLSFSFDPFSEIYKFGLERKREAENTFTQVAQINSGNGNLTFEDPTGNPSEQNIYRLAAINNCGNKVVYSNLAGNIVLKINMAGNTIDLHWNSYSDWLGGVSYYKVFLNTGSGYYERMTIQPADTVLTMKYSDLMYEISGNKICFYVIAREQQNIFNITGESVSMPVCTESTEKVTVPNAFTPDNDLVNDLFKPVLSFTPVDYHLIITDRQNNRLFETNDHLASWDGTKSGSPLPPGVYLWFLKLKTPSGKIISKTGTVTIIK